MAFMEEAKLHDVDTSGPQFTWVTRRTNHGYMAARLDRVLVNDGFLDIWHSATATVLPRISSDHHPILLTLQENAAHSIRPFRFQTMWATHPSFLPLVSDSWRQFVTSSNPIHRVTQKLKRLKASLKNWNKVIFRNIFVEMEAATAALEAIQTESATLGDSDDRLLEEIECTNRLNTALSRHQIMSTQRNRLQWLQDGDRNSKFFHNMNRIRKISFGLSSMIVDDVLTFDPGIISDSVIQFYSELFTASDQDPYDDTILGEFIQPLIDPVENEMLTAIPGVDEIKRATFDMEPSSSPGPDGFGGSFYQTCWDIIALDVIAAVQFFFTTRHIPFGLNSSFVTLIPKNPGANRVEDFRPIVMGNYLFKIFTKILASRLGGVAARILSPLQFGFVPGKSIHTCIALASDTINILDNPRLRGNMAIKIDMHKAFDTVSWRFLISMLQRLGFSASFCALISSILESARLSVHINGTPHGYFACSRGVRQGDPLSPLLFCLAEEALGRWIDWEVASGRITQIKRSPCYLLYADDILIFAKATVGNIQRLQSVLHSYGGLSGQIYNPAKSKVYFGSIVPTRIKNFMLRTTGITQGSLPMSYLGVPIFRGAPRVCHLAPLADSIISRFAKWKGNTLSLAGRKCLINSVIAASLVHSMMVYYWPRTLLKKIETAMRNFLWTGDITRRNTSCTVSWARVCAPLEEGGFGVRSIRHANDSFICKLAWDILCNKTLDTSMLHDRYISGRSRPRHYGSQSSIWPGIRRHLGRLEDGSRWIVGKFSKINFWNDNWLGYTISEKIGIPHFFADGLMSTIKDYFFDGLWHFDQDFLLKHTDIVRDILSVHISRGEDTRVWGHSASGEMTSSLAYDHLRANHPRIGWSSWIWGRSIPPCRSTLIWRAIWGKLPTADWLCKFGVQGPTVCYLCFNAAESLDHIFAYCRFTRNLLDRVTALFDIFLYYDIGFLDVFLQATRYKFSKQLDHLWRIAFITTLWSIWFARNRAIFDDIQPSTQSCLAKIMSSIRETDHLAFGHFSATVRELMILSRLGLSGRPSPPTSTIAIRWKPPQPGWTKVNVDGSAPISPGPIFAGAVFRNSRGFFMAAFSKPVGRGYPLDAELASILHAILFAFECGWISLWVESDSTLAINTLLRSIQTVPWKLQGLWEKVQLALPHMRVTFSHILREGNQAADTIAKTHSDEVWFGNGPQSLDHILYRDMNSDYFRCVNS
ncbi:hypothetical protein ACS0TY_003398 [Phlomoides rotata]